MRERERELADKSPCAGVQVAEAKLLHNIIRADWK